MHHRVMHCEWMIRTLIRIFSDLRPDTLDLCSDLCSVFLTYDPIWHRKA